MTTMIKYTIPSALALVILLFAGCEDNMFLRSSKKMKEELQGTWKRNHLGQFPGSLCRITPADTSTVYFQEYWIFKDDKLYTVFDFGTDRSCFNNMDAGTPDLSVVADTINNFYVDSEPKDTNVVANFSIDADVFKAFLNLEFISGNNINDQNLFLVPSWEFVELEDDRLYIAADNETGNEVLQKEFYRVK
jgi:hypothetical protein